MNAKLINEFRRLISLYNKISSARDSSRKMVGELVNISIKPRERYLISNN